MISVEKRKPNAPQSVAQSGHDVHRLEAYATDHGINCSAEVVTISQAPAALSLGITSARLLRSTAERTECQPSVLSEDMVGCRIDGRTASTASSLSLATLRSIMTRPRARNTASKSKPRSSSCVLISGFCMASLEAYNRVEDFMISSMICKPLARSVEPVAVLSMIRSASSGGKTSVAP